MKRLLIRSLKIAFLFLFWSQSAFGQCALDDFLAEIQKNGLKDLFKESPEEYFEAWKIIYSEKDEVLALIRQNPDNLKKIKSYIDAQNPDVKRLKDSFERARNEDHAQKWIDLKISQKDLDATDLDLTTDPTPWTKDHKAQRWKNYQASDEPKLDFNEWSNVYDGNIDKATSADQVVKKYRDDNNLVGFKTEQSNHAKGLTIEFRGKAITGDRRHDLFNETTREALEIKDYRSQKVYLSEDIEREVRMDLKLLESGDIEEMTWVFLGEGPSEPLRRLLTSTLSNGKKIKIIP